jgi:hypothetical protein
MSAAAALFIRRRHGIPTSLQEPYGVVEATDEAGGFVHLVEHQSGIRA